MYANAHIYSEHHRSSKLTPVQLASKSFFKKPLHKRTLSWFDGLSKTAFAYI